MSIVGFFLTILSSPGKQKQRKIQSFMCSAYKNDILQHAENYVNTSVFARYRDFCYQRQKKNSVNIVVVGFQSAKIIGIYNILQCFLVRECQKYAKTQPI